MVPLIAYCLAVRVIRYDLVGKVGPTLTVTDQQQMEAAVRHCPPAPKDDDPQRQGAQRPYHPLLKSDVSYGHSWCVNIFCITLFRYELMFLSLEKTSYPGHPPLEPCFENHNMGEVVECLIKQNLIFPVTLDQTTKAWEGIDAAFQDHLSAHGFDLKRRDGDDGSDFNKLSWDVMTKKKSKDKIRYSGGSQDCKTFNIEFVSKEAIQVNLQNETNELPFLFLGMGPSHNIICCHLTKGPVPSSQLGIRFTGQNLTFKTRTMNGPDVSLRDIIKFFGEKMPAGFQRAVTSPAIFQNHRTCHLHVQWCI